MIRANAIGGNVASFNCLATDAVIDLSNLSAGHVVAVGPV